MKLTTAVFLLVNFFAAPELASAAPGPQLSPAALDPKFSCPELAKVNYGCDEYPGPCGELRWKFAGCKKQAECGTLTGSAAKKCCDDRDLLPLELSQENPTAYYTIYMNACAPQYKLLPGQGPKYIDLPCDAHYYSCASKIDDLPCEMRQWESAGCRRRNVCRSIPRLTLEECCATRTSLPTGQFEEFFRERYNRTCLLSYKERIIEANKEVEEEEIAIIKDYEIVEEDNVEDGNVDQGTQTVEQGNVGQGTHKVELGNVDQGTHKVEHGNADQGIHKVGQGSVDQGTHKVEDDNVDQGTHKVEEDCE